MTSSNSASRQAELPIQSPDGMIIPQSAWLASVGGGLCQFTLNDVTIHTRSVSPFSQARSCLSTCLSNILQGVTCFSIQIDFH